MEAYFERRFNPAEVDRFVYSDIDAVKYYTQKRKKTQRIVLGLTTFTVLLCSTLLMLAFIGGSSFIILLGGLITIGISGIFYHQLRSYYWHNFCLKIVQHNQQATPNHEVKTSQMLRFIVIQSVSLASLLLSLSISVLVEPITPVIPPTPSMTYTPTATHTPIWTYTPSMTFTPSATPTATHTPLPTATPTPFVQVASPRSVAIYVCPDVNCEVLAIREPQATLALIARGAWVEVQLADGRRGFIPSFLVHEPHR